MSRRQLLAIEVTAAAVRHLIATGWLIPVHAGVYAVGYVNRTPLARACAAVLACGEKAVLSHGSAASLWGFNQYWDVPFEVTVAGSHRRRPGIRVHRSRTLTGPDNDCQLGIPVTSPARTALDIASGLTDDRLTRVVNDARHARVLHLDDLADVVARNPKHPGTRRLRRFVETPAGPTRSELEDAFLAFAQRHGLPAPVTNTYVLGHEVDVLFVAERVIVEVDSWEFHRFRSNFEGDRDRDADFLAGGYLTVRDHRRTDEQRPRARGPPAPEDPRRSAANSYGSLKYDCKSAGHGRTENPGAPGQLRSSDLHRIVKRKLVIGGAALAVAAFAGGAYAATQNSGPSTRQAFLNDVAKRLHVSPQQLSSALNGAFLDQLQAAVQDGRLTQAQANALEQRLKQKGTVPAVPFGHFGFGPRGFGPRGLVGPPGGLPGGPPGGPPRAFGGAGVLAGPGALQAAASYLGLTNAQLFQQLSSGKSLADVAGSKGKLVSGLEQAMTAAVKTRLDKLVSGKVITAAQEQKMLSALSARIAQEVNAKGLPLRKAFRPGLRFPKGGVPAPKNAPVPPAYLPAPYGLPAPTA